MLEFAAPKTISSFTMLPRQDNNRNGWIKDYAVFASADGQSWGEPVAKGTFAGNAELKTVPIAPPATARFLKLVALSGHASGPWASVAEFTVTE